MPKAYCLQLTAYRLNFKHMKYQRIQLEKLPISISLSSFHSEQSADEHHAMIELTEPGDVDSQFMHIESAIWALQERLGNCTLVLERYFVSDSVNQAIYLNKSMRKSAVSVVQQPPLNGTKVAVWTYWVEQSKTYRAPSGCLVLERPHFKHLYNTQLHTPLQDEHAETRHIFNSYTAALAQHDCRLKDHCIRTWIYVQGVDIHYKKMVEARVDYFNKEGLNKETHYLASTGIEGRHTNPQSLVLMDAYAIEGVKPEQITFLKALSHLNPTIEYGVTFERATAVDYAERRHIYLSGTASINHRGEVVHPWNIVRQTERTLENMEVLLAEGEASMSDIAQMIVYLRDTADYRVVHSYLSKHFPNTPKVLVLAPVCRPGWLIEIECIAITKQHKADFAPF